MTVSFGIGSFIEGGVVAAVIVLNIVVGFFQEYSAEKTEFFTLFEFSHRECGS
jgi:Na+-exporting ATPase